MNVDTFLLAWGGLFDDYGVESIPVLRKEFCAKLLCTMPAGWALVPVDRGLSEDVRETFKAAMKTLHHADYPGGNLWEITTVREKSLMLKAWRAALSRPVDIDALAQEIRRIDGSNSLGAGALAERIVEWLGTRPVVEQTIPAAQAGQAQGDHWAAKGVVHDYDPEVDGSSFYDLESVDNAVHAVTHDEGEDDSVTVLERVALALENRFGGASIWEVFDRLEAATAPAVDRGLSEVVGVRKELGTLGGLVCKQCGYLVAEQAMRAEDGAMVYRGHTVAYIYDRAEALSQELLKCWGVLGECGHDSTKHLQPLHERLKSALAASSPSQAEPTAAEADDGGWRAGMVSAEGYEPPRDLCARNPAPNASVPLVPTSITRTVQVGAPPAGRTLTAAEYAARHGIMPTAEWCAGWDAAVAASKGEQA